MGDNIRAMVKTWKHVLLSRIPFHGNPYIFCCVHIDHKMHSSFQKDHPPTDR